MAQKWLDSFTMLMIAVAVVAGGMGGGSVAGIHILRGKRVRAIFFLAYVIVGAALGLTLFYFGHLFGIQSTTPEEFVGKAFLFSLVGTLIVASKDFGVRWTLERFGWKMTVTVYRDERKQGRAPQED